MSVRFPTKTPVAEAYRGLPSTASALYTHVCDPTASIVRR